MIYIEDVFEFPVNKFVLVKRKLWIYCNNMLMKVAQKFMNSIDNNTSCQVQDCSLPSIKLENFRTDSVIETINMPIRLLLLYTLCISDSYRHHYKLFIIT